MVNKPAALLNVVAVKAPALANAVRLCFEDIAILTEAKPQVRRTRREAGACLLSSLGTAKRVVIDKEKTTIADGAPASPMKSVCAEAAIRAQIEETTSDYDRESCRNASSPKLQVGGVAAHSRRCGYRNRNEGKERLREDALNATRAAVEGIIPGGGNGRSSADHQGPRRHQAR